MQDQLIFIILILCLVYYRFHDYIQVMAGEPLFYVSLAAAGVFLYFLYYLTGHYIEKILNKIRMWRLGINTAYENKPLFFPFLPFDLQAQLDKFYKDKSNIERTFLGLDAEKSNKDIVSLSDLQRSQHMQVLGMTGTGKTTSLFLPLIYQDALKNRPVIILDAKGEMEAINQLNGILGSIGRSDDFLLFSLSHKEISCTYNPLYVGECDPQIIVDAFFNDYKDDNSFYRETSKTLFTNVFYILHSLGKPFTPMDIYTYLTNLQCRKEVNKEIKKNQTKGDLYLKLFNAVISRLTDQYKGWEHVVTGFNNYLLNHKDAILNEDDSDIILTDVIRQRKIVYFQLPTNAYPILAKSVARMVQANLRYISSLIQVGRLPKDILVSVIIDEYSSFAEETFVEVLNKARSSGMMVTLAHQSLSDLTAISDSFMKRIDENTLNKIYLKQTDPQLCELIARSMGTFLKQEKTYRMAGGRFGNQIPIGESSDRLVNEFHFAPDKIKNLNKQGQGYFVYRGNNGHTCVNFGRFENIKEVPYEKKVKKNKRRGLELFERYYVDPRPSDDERLNSANRQPVLEGVIECDD